MNPVERAAAAIKPGSKGKRLLIVGAVLLLVLAGGWWWQQSRDRVDYITLASSRGSIVNAVNAAGMVEAVKSVGLDFRTVGVVKDIYVQPGDTVKAGQLLARLDSADLEAQLVARQTELAKAEISAGEAGVEYQKAQDEAKRNQVLFDEGALSQVDLDNSIASRDSASAKLATAEADIEAARAQVAVSQANLLGCQIRAPWDGIVSQVQGEAGEVSGGGGGDNSSFISLITPTLQVRAKINEADMGRIKLGQEAEFSVNAFPDKVFKGKITYIAPQGETVSNVQLYDVLISVDNPGSSLRAGMSANVNIVLSRQDGVITIPRAALAFATKNMTGGIGGNGPGGKAGTSGSASGLPGQDLAGDKNEAGQQAAVLVLENDRPVPRKVVVGLSDESNVEIKSGLAEGEPVVIGSTAETGAAGSGSSSMRPGQTMGIRVR